MRHPRHDAQPARIFGQRLDHPDARLRPMLPKQRHRAPLAQTRGKSPRPHHIAAAVDPVDHRSIAGAPYVPLPLADGVRGGHVSERAPTRSNPGSPIFTPRPAPTSASPHRTDTPTTASHPPLLPY